MRYTLEFKLRCIELYKQGLWPETPYGFKNAENFHKEIKKLVDGTENPSAI